MKKRIAAAACAVIMAMSMSVNVLADSEGLYTGYDMYSVSDTDADISDARVKFYKKYTNTADSITLNWSALEGADGYILYRYDPSTGKWVKRKKTKELSFEDKGLLSGKAYKYYITAYNKTSTSKNSEVKLVTTRPDAVPFKVTTKKKGEATVKWKKVRGATGYEIFYKDSADDDWTKVKTVGADVRSYTKKGLAGHYHGRLAVRAVKEFKDRTFSGKLSKVKVYKYPYAAKRLDKKGWTLKKAFMASVIKWRDPNSSLPRDGDTTTEWYAEYGFKHNYGHCFVMAGMFTEMAWTMGYDVKQVWGYVPSRRGGLTEHSWVEVNKNGTTYVCDPDFQYAYPAKNGYMFKYGTKGTWKYKLVGDVATEG